MVMQWVSARRTGLVILIFSLASVVVIFYGVSVVAQDAPKVPQRPDSKTPLPRPLRWKANLALSPTGAVIIAGKTYYSSSKLQASWTPPEVAVDHYEINVTDGVSLLTQTFSVSTNNSTLTELKSGTSYSVNLKACFDRSCAQSVSSDTANATTSEEYWQVQGTGNSYETATKAVVDGNIGAYVLKFGAWAGAELSGRLQLYYNPLAGAEKGIKTAVTPTAVTDPASASSFTGISDYGLRMPCPPTAPGQPPANCPGTSLVRNVALFQAVPMNGFVRLFFEANGTDLRNRILYLDSQDGYVGRDFNRGARTLCQTMADYSAGGECEPKIAIGVQGDTIEANDGIQHARQFKIVYPKLNDERWDEAVGAAMVFTVNVSNQACSPYSFTQGYAVWNGFRWQVQYQANGCPKLFEQMQAPNPVHLGGVRYKLYFNNTTALRGQPTNPLTDIKPMKVFYADGKLTGNLATVEFEDWEPTASAREVHYLWPDGTLLDVANESKLDDHVTLMPTGDPNFQVIYTNMSGGQNSQQVPFVGLAALVNP